MKKRYINPELEVVMLGITHPLMVGSIIVEGGGLEDLINGGDSEGGKVADGHEFADFFDEDDYLFK